MNQQSYRFLNGQDVSRNQQIFSSAYTHLCDCAPAAALQNLNSSPTGLSDKEVESRRKQYGPNRISQDQPPTWHKQLLQAFMTPFNGLLLIASIISVFSDIIFADPADRSFKTVVVLCSMVLLSTLLRFWQEFRSNRAAQQLKAMVSPTALVLRAGDPQPQERPVTSLVPGDIIHLSAGDMIPADVRLLTSKDLFVSQSMLTGESLPLGKNAIAPAEHAETPALNPLEIETVCFMGTSVVSGAATAVVVATGDATYFAAISRDIARERPLTSFDVGINNVSWLLVRFILVMAPLVFLINVLTKGDWLLSLLFAASVAVGLTPEMLPMIVTSNLAKGAMRMARRKTIVKKLNAIQNLGAMDILCTDKTGTLTQDRVLLERHLDLRGHEDEQVLGLAWINSFHQTGLKNLLDVAVLEYAQQHDLIGKLQHYQKVDEIPFDFTRRRMSVVVRHSGKDLLVCKGAVEEVESLCSSVVDNTACQGSVVRMTDELRQAASRLTQDLNKDGLRVLAVAYKYLDADERSFTVSDERDLILAGFVAFLDPPKETAAEAIKALKNENVRIKIITGDNEIVTRKICRDVGLYVERAMLGSDTAALTNTALANEAEHTTIFTKMSPLDKARVIRALRSKGHTVGYLGDGVNDASALKAADVGISVDTAVDITKETADIILLEKSLMVLSDAVIEGRKTFANTIKYIKMTASSNFGNVFSVLIASIFLPFLPMLPVQMLIQNLLYDVSQVSIPWDHVDEDYLGQPRKWDAGGIARFMVFLGPASSIFDVVTFVLMWNVFGADSIQKQSLFQSGWFVVGLLTQTLIVHMIRTQHVPFIQSRAAPPVMLLTLAVMAVGLVLPFSPVGTDAGMTPLPMPFFAWLGGILLSYCLFTQLVKRFYIRRFGQWL